MTAEFVVAAPRIFAVLLAVVLLIVLLSMFIKRGSIVRKITALVIVLVVLGIVAFLFYRPTIVAVGEQGIAVKRFRERTVPWKDVIEAEWIEDLSVSEYRPARRIVGVGLGAYKLGKFRLQNGAAVQVVMEQDRDALFIGTARENYLFGLDENDRLVEAVGRYLEVGAR